jgi:tRNA-specific 2-thiouridylase
MRAHGQPLPATVHISEAGDPAESTVTIDLTDPTWGIAPGQGAVFYDGDRVLGSALITGTQARESVNKG